MTANNEKSNVGIHFFYVGLILVAIIILLATAEWTKLEGFTDYLSTAATITSLVLALLAIIYAYISNDSLTRTTGIVSEAADEAHKATTEISSLLNTVESLARNSDQSNISLSKTLGELTQQIGTLSQTASTFDRQANEISSILQDIPKGLGKLEKQIQEYAQMALPSRATEADTKAIPDKDMEAIANNSFNGASPSGAFLLYSCYLSFKSQKPLELNKISDISTTTSYWYGYLIALFSTHLIECNQIPKIDQPFIVTKCPEVFGGAKRTTVDWLDKLQDETLKNTWRKMILDIETALAS
jgi:hypothetical protein